ncbi:DUF4384 domain-containing protein [Tropicimonas sp. IMCC6043]|uniref:DUF4384 domain-containing protein n=1 Tax=Tropicimonas sp. IMCC6043 TaxID=2510645 RepID=UPI00101D4062|nr:DUF4384 domain-containing protein [Tropicimonas sp. IMCC6043]RYH09338.1 DUF4384 domain-containing protein [Tropicimonas sp. IMCC6043]
MTARPATWALAGAGSVALHGGALLLLALALVPRPVPEQRPPPTEVTLSADTLRRTRAREEAAEARPAEGREARGEALGLDAPRRTEARPAVPGTQRLAAAAPEVARPDALTDTAAQALPATPRAQALESAAASIPPAADARPDVTRSEALNAEPGTAAEAVATSRPAAGLEPEPAPRPALVTTGEASAALEARPRVARPDPPETTATSLAGLTAASRPARLSQRRPEPATTLPPVVVPARAGETPTEAASQLAPDSPTAGLLTDVAMPAELLAGPSESLAADDSHPPPAPAGDPMADSTKLARLEAGATPLGATPPPSGPPAATLPASGAPVVPGRAEATTAGRIDPDRPAASETPADAAASRITAALAWQLGDTSLADPVSIAAVQAFMQPEAAESGGAPVRDALEALLTGIPCARLQTEFVPETATLELRGHIPEDSLRAPLLEALGAQMGSEIRVADEMRLLPPPQCNALSGIAAVGLPQSEDQRQDPRIVGTNAHVREYRFGAGERLELDLQAPDYDAFLYVDYFDADGNVLHLQPNELVPLASVPAKASRRVGSDADGEPALDITIAPPFGQEIAVAFATSRPLYDGERPLVEPAGPYLDFLRSRVAEARAEEDDFKGEWVYFFIATGPAG